jgi:Sortilin, neurotensin receptor 3,
LTIAWGNPLALLTLKTSGPIARSTDQGATWTDVLNPGVQLSAVQFAPSDDNLAYVGADNGRMWISANSGVTWNELDTSALPNARVQSIAVHWSTPRRLYVAFAGTGIRHLWRGDVDAAGNVIWFDVSGLLPAVSLPDLPLTGLALHPILEETIFVSTMLGVLRSTDGGDSWAPFDEGLPNVFVSDLDMRRNDRSLWASTMGRGIFRRYV